MTSLEYERYAYLAMARRRGYTKVDEAMHLLWLKHHVKAIRLQRLQRLRRTRAIRSSMLYPFVAGWLGI